MPRTQFTLVILTAAMLLLTGISHVSALNKLVYSSVCTRQKWAVHFMHCRLLLAVLSRGHDREAPRVSNEVSVS